MAKMRLPVLAVCNIKEISRRNQGGVKESTILKLYYHYRFLSEAGEHDGFGLGWF
jgi:hypothetical protein